MLSLRRLVGRGEVRKDDRGCLGSAYHCLVRKFPDFLNSLRCPLLEAGAVDALVEVDGVFAGDNVGDGRTLGLSGLWFGGHSVRKKLIESARVTQR